MRTEVQEAYQRREPDSGEVTRWLQPGGGLCYTMDSVLKPLVGFSGNLVGTFL